MPPIPRSRRAFESEGWRIKPLFFVLFVLFAAAAGGGGVWLFQRPSVASSADNSFEGTAPSTSTDWEKKIKKLELELADAEEQLREAKREREKLRQTIAEQQPKVEWYDKVVGSFTAANWRWLNLQYWRNRKGNEDAIPPDKNKKKSRDDVKRKGKGQELIPRHGPHRPGDDD